MPKIPKKQAAPRSTSKAKYSAFPNKRVKKSMSTPEHVPRTETRGTEHRGAGKKNELFGKPFPARPVMKKQAETTVKKSVASKSSPTKSYTASTTKSTTGTKPAKPKRTKPAARRKRGKH